MTKIEITANKKHEIHVQVAAAMRPFAVSIAATYYYH